jgi:hypothetical protein
MTGYFKTSAIAFEIDAFYNQQDYFKGGLQNNNVMRDFLYSLKKDHHVVVMGWNDKSVSRALRELKNDRLVDDYIISPAYNQNEKQSFYSVPLKYNINPDNTLFFLASYNSYRTAEKEELKNIHYLKVQETNALKDSFFKEKNEIHVDSRKSFEKIKEEAKEFTNVIKANVVFPL